jgi:hypothetical protein
MAGLDAAEKVTIYRAASRYAAQPLEINVSHPALPRLVARCAIAFALSLSAVAFAGTTIYVDPRGDDARDGASPATALKSLERARDVIREKRAAKQLAGAVDVELAPGQYVLTRPLDLSKDDSGSADAPVTWRSREPGAASLIGAVPLKVSSLKPVTDPAVLERLDESARAHVRMLPLKDSGIAHTGPFPPKFDDRGGIFELFDDAGRLPLSRWPNAGYVQMKEVLVNGDKNTPGVFVYDGDRPSRWTKNHSVWLRGQWRVAWEDPAIKVDSIDAAKSTITFAQGLPLGIGSKYHRPKGSGKEPWCAINLIEEIDQPGEWAIDFDSQTLYVWPRDEKPDASLLITQLEKPLVQMTGTSFVRWIGTAIEHSAGDGIVLENAADCLVAGNVVRNIGGRGVVAHGERITIQSNDVHDVGQGCVYISGGDRKSIRKSGNEVINNHLHHYGVLKRQYAAAVHVGVVADANGMGTVRDAVGIRVANNVIHHGPRDAVLFSGNDNLYELNEIYYCGYDSDDLGSFYSWLDWTMRGNVIRHNYIHDTVGGVNPDDGAAGNIVYGNVFAGPRVGVWIASGPDNVTRHNIFVKESGPVFGMDDRGDSRGYATNKRLIDRVKELNPTEEPWKSAHPELATMLDNHPELPWRTKFVGNLIVSKDPAAPTIKMKGDRKADPALIEIRDNVTVAEDPGFAAAANHDYTLPIDSDVLKRIPGFEPIPFREIGLKLDAYRKALPDDSQRQRGKEFSPFAKDGSRNFGT